MKNVRKLSVDVISKSYQEVIDVAWKLKSTGLCFFVLKCHFSFGCQRCYIQGGVESPPGKLPVVT